MFGPFTHPYAYPGPTPPIFPCVEVHVLAVFGREERERRACPCHDAVDLALEYLPGIGVDLYNDVLARLYSFKLGLFIVRDEPDVAEVHNRHKRLASLHLVAGLNGPSCHIPVRTRI